MKTRKAMCSCGPVAIVAQGEPGKISVCHCLACQRRTVCFRYRGVFCHRGNRGFGLLRRVFPDRRQRPTCGSTAFWDTAFRPGLRAVAFGCFEDRKGLEPTQGVYDARRYSWATVQTA